MKYLTREKFIGDKLYKLTKVMSPKSLEEFQIAVQEYKNIILIRHPIQRLVIQLNPELRRKRKYL